MSESEKTDSAAWREHSSIKHRQNLEHDFGPGGRAVAALDPSARPARPHQDRPSASLATLAPGCGGRVGFGWGEGSGWSVESGGFVTYQPVRARPPLTAKQQEILSELVEYARKRDAAERMYETYLLRAWGHGVSQSEIARWLGVSATAVRLYLKRRLGK